MDYTGHTHVLPAITGLTTNPINDIEPRMYVNAYTYPQVCKILSLLTEILLMLDTLTDWHHFSQSASKVSDLSRVYELSHRDYANYSDEKKAVTVEAVTIAQSVFREHKTLEIFSNVVNRLSFVILQVCEGSIHRMD